MKLPLKPKLVLAIVAAGLIPALVIGALAIKTTSTKVEDVGKNCEEIARNIADKLDRNLFERYGDVQAFGVNDAVHDRTSWYQPGSENNRITAAANQYAKLYGFYQLSYVVDLEGKVVAVNDRDPAGKPINTAWLYQKNFKNAEWFQACLAGRFTKSDSLDGTFLEDLHVDEDVKKAYGNDGLVLGFSAPVKDATGRVIGVWRNCANFSLVEEIVSAPYQQFKKMNCPQAEITLLDRQGRVIVDYDPTLRGNEAVQRDFAVLQPERQHVQRSSRTRRLKGYAGRDALGVQQRRVKAARRGLENIAESLVQPLRRGLVHEGRNAAFVHEHEGAQIVDSVALVGVSVRVSH